MVFALRAYIIDHLQLAMVFGDTFPVAVNFVVENLFPGAETEFALGVLGVEYFLTSCNLSTIF